MQRAGLLIGVLLLAACAPPPHAVGAAGNGDAVAMVIAGHTYRAENSTQFVLPGVLTEISGLTLDDAGRLYAHDDERGIVYQIDYQAGHVLARFGLGAGLREDFEGIAWLAGRLYMTTSKGQLFAFAVGAPDSMVSYETHTQGLDCEVEGLTRSVDGTALLAACKNRPKGRKALHLHRWQPGDEGWYEEPAVRIQRSQFNDLFESLGIDRPEKFQPTAVSATPGGNLLLIAGPQKVLLEFTVDGTPVAVAPLRREKHRQPEGIAITNEGILIIADEGDNKGSNRTPGMLTVYRPDTEGQNQ